MVAEELLLIHERSYPLDTLKTRYQSPHYKRLYIDPVKNTVRRSVLFSGKICSDGCLSSCMADTRSRIVSGRYVHDTSEDDQLIVRREWDLLSWLLYLHVSA